MIFISDSFEMSQTFHSLSFPKWWFTVRRELQKIKWDLPPWMSKVNQTILPECFFALITNKIRSPCLCWWSIVRKTWYFVQLLLNENCETVHNIIICNDNIFTKPLWINIFCRLCREQYNTIIAHTNRNLLGNLGKLWKNMFTSYPKKIVI